MRGQADGADQAAKRGCGASKGVGRGGSLSIGRVASSTHSYITLRTIIILSCTFYGSLNFNAASNSEPICTPYTRIKGYYIGDQRAEALFKLVKRSECKSERADGRTDGGARRESAVATRARPNSEFQLFKPKPKRIAANRRIRSRFEARNRRLLRVARV
ncbi:hypothetical protein V9T40_013177 [Parthenolecanium corni]|uniref:Uncharacterized protein n=1 Tax=Parthenolecanium corni TaxID=536013 RepID=A0AAN9TJF0_9HEMI